MLLKVFIILVILSIILKTKSSFSVQFPFCMGDVCYTRPESTSRGNWTEAQQICQSSAHINFSATLPIVDNLKHQQKFEVAARCLTTDGELKLGIWIGAKASYSKPGNWTWLNGSNYSETELQSQRDYGKSYAFVTKTSTGVHANAADPIEKYSYICYYPTGTDKQIDNIVCKSGDGGTVLNTEPLCYVKYDGQVSWFHARNNCLASGGDLASFTNISILDGQIGPNKFWVGLRSSQWNWQNAATGSSSDVTYTLWYSGQPDDNASSCISTDAGEKFPNWRDYSCSESLPFICQFTPPFESTSVPEICATPSIAPRHTELSSLRSSTIASNIATSPTVSSIGDQPENDTGSSVNTVNKVALAVGLGVGIGVPVFLALVVIVIVISVRRKRRNSNTGGNSKSRETAASNNSLATQENDRIEMSEMQNGRPHYDNFSAQYATIPTAAAGPKLDAPSTQGTVYADLSFDQARPS